MDLSFRVDAMQSEGQWFGVVRLNLVEIFRTTEGFDSRGKAETGAKVAFAEAMKELLASRAGVTS